MQSPWITVPYSYRAEVQPSPRHRNSQSTWLRGDMLIEVPVLWPGEYEAAFELPADQCIGGHYRRVESADRMVISHKERLYTRLLVGGQPVDFAGAQRAFSECAVLGVGEAGMSPFRFTEMATYPLSRHHWLSPRNGPLSVRSLPSHALHEGWTRPRLITSDQFARELEAAGTLTGAFAIVDDVMYIECVEPVWTLSHIRHRRYRLIVETLPWATYAVDHFRLDRHSEALAWARGRRIKLAPTDIVPAIDIFKPAALNRSDELELARDAARNWPRSSGGFLTADNPGEDQPELRRVLATLANDGLTAEPGHADQAMTALEQVLPVLGRAYSPYLALLLTRWKSERPDADLFSLPPYDAEDLSPEDLAALQNLPPSCSGPAAAPDEPPRASPEPANGPSRQKRSRRPCKKRRSATASRSLKSRRDTP